MIVFCTTCKGRTPHLSLTLPINIRDNQYYEDCKFVVLDYNSQDDLGIYLQSRHADDIASGKLVVYTMVWWSSGGVRLPFRMAHAKNIAHRCGMLEGADILVNLDADNYTGPDFAEYIASAMSGTRYLWAKMIPGEMTRGISGRIIVTSKAFMKVGGYDEKYETWSPDDKDFNYRLAMAGYIGEPISAEFLNSVMHNNKMRFKEYKHIETDNEDSNIGFVNPVSAIANYGKVGCGVVYRNFDFSKPITIGPLPTRIFGIGMHKTGTVSLHTAFKILGYDSSHWKSARWAKQVFNDISVLRPSHIVESGYAFSDFPFAVLYQQLDSLYPGSKFILTVRPEDQWLESVRSHWSYEDNPFRKQWNSDGFTHDLHAHVYGTREFDAETFLARYRDHNEQVINYFADRPNDILVFDGSGWKELCDFLHRPVPRLAYPKAHLTKENS